jgi:O-acetyl-ADP-ribose deacetylase (regulator of RNase III)
MGGMGKNKKKSKKDIGAEGLKSDKPLKEHKFEDGRLIQVRKGDLTCEEVDIIVNAANNQLRHNGGLAAAIVNKGGDKIQDDCDSRIKKKGSLEDGEIYTTKGYNLPCKYVIHAVGPSWKGGINIYNRKVNIKKRKY